MYLPFEIYNFGVVVVVINFVLLLLILLHGWLVGWVDGEVVVRIFRYYFSTTATTDVIVIVITKKGNLLICFV